MSERSMRGTGLLALLVLVGTSSGARGGDHAGLHGQPADESTMIRQEEGTRVASRPEEERPVASDVEREQVRWEGSEQRAETRIETGEVQRLEGRPAPRARLAGDERPDEGRQVALLGEAERRERISTLMDDRGIDTTGSRYGEEGVEERAEEREDEGFLKDTFSGNPKIEEIRGRENLWARQNQGVVLTPLELDRETGAL